MLLSNYILLFPNLSGMSLNFGAPTSNGTKNDIFYMAGGGGDGPK